MSAHPPLKMQKSFSVVQLGSDGGIRQSIGVRKEGGAGFVPEFPLESNGWQDVRSRAGFTHLDVDVIGLAGFALGARLFLSFCHHVECALVCLCLLSLIVTGCCAARRTTDERRRRARSNLLLSQARECAARAPIRLLVHAHTRAPLFMCSLK
jgi:hypothetical protein